MTEVTQKDIELLDQKIESLRELFNLRLDANDKAVELQNSNNYLHFEQLNNLEKMKSDELQKMQLTYLPKCVYDIQHENLKKKVESIPKIVYVSIAIAVLIITMLDFLFRMFL